VALLVVPIAIAAAAVVWRPRVEDAVRARIAREAAARGLAVRVDSVRVGIWPPLTLSGVRVEKPGTWSAETNEARLTLYPWARRVRVALGPLSASGPGGLAVDMSPAEWETPMSQNARIAVELRGPVEGLSLLWTPAPGGGRLEGTARDAPLGRLLTVRRNGLPVVDAGVASGTFQIALVDEDLRFEVDLAGQGVRLAALENEDTPEEGKAVEFGEPTDVTVRLEGAWRRGAGELDLRRWHVTVDGATLSGSVALHDAPRDPSLEVSLEVERIDFARLLRTSGLAHASAPPIQRGGPQAVAAREDALDASDLGSASLSATFHGRLQDPSTFAVTQRLDFTPPARVPPAIARLRGDFVHEVPLPGGGQASLSISPGSPDFIPFAEVPPLFVRTLLLAEDAGFYGHRGIDLGELPAAVLTNWARGRAARGASTITQQLAKNLFLSRDKRMGRKLQELSLALLLETTLSKQRILEIYLNVIEWGPGLHGLRPAARRYFHEEPARLTPRQMAFLVALIPGPIKYQRSFAHGTLSPGFRPLVDDLLAKLRSVDALTEEEYQDAMAEELIVDTAEFFSGGQ
jgi:hypothetical protein